MSNPKALLDAARRAFESNDVENAEAYAKQLIERFPNSNASAAAQEILDSIAVKQGKEQELPRVASEDKSSSGEVYSQVKTKSRYEYKMVQVPPGISVQSKDHRGNEAAAYLQTIVDSHAQDGWEFYRVDEIGVTVKPDCIAGLFGQTDSYSLYYVVSFRR